MIDLRKELKAYGDLAFILGNGINLAAYGNSKCLNNHPYCKQPSREVQKIMENANWKYTSLTDPRSLSWGKIYERMNLPKLMPVLSFSSQYVHGIGMSDIWADQSDNFTAIYNFARTLIAKATQQLPSIFNCNEEFLREGLLSSPYINEVPKHYLDDIILSSKHRN